MHLIARIDERGDLTRVEMRKNKKPVYLQIQLKPNDLHAKVKNALKKSIIRSWPELLQLTLKNTKRLQWQGHGWMDSCKQLITTYLTSKLE